MKLASWLRELHGSLENQRLSLVKNISSWNRINLRNTIERKRLKKQSFSIISNTCIGGVICHDLGLPFLSPTINLYIRPCDFVKFCADIQCYLEQEFIEVTANSCSRLIVKSSWTLE